MQDKKLTKVQKGCALVFGILIGILVINSFDNSGAEKIGTAPQNENKTSSPTKGTFAIGDIVKSGDYALTVNGVSTCLSNNQFDLPKPGYKFVTVDVTQENKGTDITKYNAWNFQIQDDKDFSYDISSSVCKQPSFATGSLQPNQKTRGYVTFEMPKENNPTTLIYTPDWRSPDQIIVNIK